MLAAAVFVTQRYRYHLLRCCLLPPAAMEGQWFVSGCESSRGEICMLGLQMLSEHLFLSLQGMSGKVCHPDSLDGKHCLKICDSE